MKFHLDAIPERSTDMFKKLVDYLRKRAGADGAEPGGCCCDTRELIEQMRERSEREETSKSDAG